MHFHNLLSIDEKISWQIGPANFIREFYSLSAMIYRYIKSKLKLQTAGKVSLLQNLTKQYVGFIKSNQLNES